MSLSNFHFFASGSSRNLFSKAFLGEGQDYEVPSWDASRVFGDVSTISFGTEDVSEWVTIKLENRDGTSVEMRGKVGDTLLQVVQEHCPGNEECTRHHKVAIKFENRDGTSVEMKGKVGDTLLQVVEEYYPGIEECEICRGGSVCTGCEVIVPGDPECPYQDPTSEEPGHLLPSCNDSQSRHGCFLKVIPEMHGITVRFPMLDEYKRMQSSKGALLKSLNAFFKSIWDRFVNLFHR